MIPDPSPTRPLILDPQIVVQTAQRADLSAAAAVIIAGFHPPGNWLAGFAPLLRWAIWQDLRQRGEGNGQQYHCLVAKVGGQRVTDPNPVVGVVEIALRTPLICPQPHFAYLSNLAVRPDYQRRGVGQQLLLACEAQVVRWGLPNLYLHVLENNHPARQLYRKIGYRSQYTDGLWPGMLLGQPKRLLLHKQLSNG
jgi:ribosomal protein S18 acetylase RimI-like enzyme